MNSEELRNWATVVAATVALLVFLVNSYLMVSGSGAEETRTPAQGRGRRK